MSLVFTAEPSGSCQAVPVVAPALARTRFTIWIIHTFMRATMLTLQKNWVSRKRETPPLTEATIDTTLNISQEMNELLLQTLEILLRKKEPIKLY